jgi:glycyl-tRNA synthetase beta chain
MRLGRRHCTRPSTAATAEKTTAKPVVAPRNSACSGALRNQTSPACIRPTPAQIQKAQALPRASAGLCDFSAHVEDATQQAWLTASLAFASSRIRSGHLLLALLTEPSLAPLAERAFAEGDYTASLQALAALKAPVDAFFESVMVNADDPALRANRLALLAALHAAMNRVADLSKLAA